MRRVRLSSVQKPVTPRCCYRAFSVASQGSAGSGLKLMHIDTFPLALPKIVNLSLVTCVAKDHRFPVGTWGRVSQILRKEYTANEIIWEAAALVEPQLLKTVHEADKPLTPVSSYVDRFIQGRMTEAELRELGFQWSNQLVDRQRVQVGATVRATQLVLSGDDPNGIAGVVGGGLHHAKKARGSGYCALNDIAVAVQHGLDAHRVKRALIVDLDVHQGDGSAAIFGGEERVVTFSMHAKKNFPFRKAISTHDVELEDSITDEEPELIVYQSGVDALKGDRLGKLSLSRECLRRRTEILLDMIATRSPLSKLVITLGGGYAADLSVEAHCDVYRAVIAWLAARKQAQAQVHAPASSTLW